MYDIGFYHQVIIQEIRTVGIVCLYTAYFSRSQKNIIGFFIRKEIKNKDEQNLKVEAAKLESKKKIVAVREQMIAEANVLDNIYDAIENLLKQLEQNSVLTEDEYLKLVDYEAAESLTVGMGAEALLELRACNGRAHGVRGGIDNQDDSNWLLDVALEAAPNLADHGTLGFKCGDLAGRIAQERSFKQGAQERQNERRTHTDEED